MRKKQASLAGESLPVSQAEIVGVTEDKAPLEVRRAWAYLVNKVYEVDPLICPKCGGAEGAVDHEFIKGRMTGRVFRLIPPTE